MLTQRTRKDGSIVDVDIVGGPVAVGGELVAKHVFYHDVSELQGQKRWLESVLNISPTAIITIDDEMNVTTWNPEGGTPLRLRRGRGDRSRHRHRSGCDDARAAGGVRPA